LPSLHVLSSLSAFRETQTAQSLIPILERTENRPCAFIGAVRTFITIPRFKRIRETPSDVMKPMIFLLSGTFLQPERLCLSDWAFLLLLVVNILILVCWSVLDPLRWRREAVVQDEYGRTTQSIGRCQSDNATPFLICLLVVNAGVVTVASYQSYVARKISTEFSESDYIAKAVTIVLTMSFVTGPMLFLTDGSTEARFFSIASSVFTVSLSVLLLIFVPKMLYSGQGIKSGIRLSLAQNAGSSDPLSHESDDSVGAMVTDHPKLNSQLAERLRLAEQEISRLKGSRSGDKPVQ
jgi:hypothetical protein